MVARYMQKIEALHAAVAQGSLREVQAMLGRAKLALSTLGQGGPVNLGPSWLSKPWAKLALLILGQVGFDNLGPSWPC